MKLEGRSIEDPRRTKIEVRRYFKELYQQKNLPIIRIEDRLVRKIQEHEAENLELMPSEKEVKEAVWSCDPSQALRSDGYFICKMWDVVGADFTNVVLNFFKTKCMDKSLNMTWVTLINLMGLWI